MKRSILIPMLAALASCTAPESPEYYGTLEPFAAEAVYFLMTDRFVDGDSTNNFPEQGGPHRQTFDRSIHVDGYEQANIGYLGGDFKGVLDNAGYIAEMGFTAVWTTPIVDNPDEAFMGSRVPGRGPGGDQGKTGFHGYWGVNFFEVDEHLESPGLTFADFTRELSERHDLKYVLDVVCNHSSPAYTMPEDQPKFGELYDAGGQLVADHENLDPEDLDPGNPLHAFYNRTPDLGELGDLNGDNPDVLAYFSAAYAHWLEQGVAALRIDTVRHMPNTYWKAFSDRMREKRPGLFMFAEAFNYDAAEIAVHTYASNGGISVLDFPTKQAMNEVFAGSARYSALESTLHLTSQVYYSPYELMTFYDNHDMDRMAADDKGFIDAHNFLFTARGIPVVYYGSEIGFRAGTNEHTGNRDYFGQDNVEFAKTHPIYRALTRIATIRKESIALQRGLQLNLEFAEDTAVFYRVYQRNGENQTALVLLNKGDDETTLDVSRWLFDTIWTDAVSGEIITLAGENTVVPVPGHGVRVLLTDAEFSNSAFDDRLRVLQQNAMRD